MWAQPKEKPKRNIKQIFAIALLMFVCVSVSFIAGTSMSYPVGYQDGAKVGYNSALVDAANLLQQKGITLDWSQKSDGSYTLTVTTASGQTGQMTIAANLYLEWRDKNGNILTSRGAGTFTNLGKNYTVQQLIYRSTIAGFASGGGASGVPLPSNTGINASSGLLYLGDATSAASSATSTVQATETQANGMGRAQETACYYSSGSSGGGVIGCFNVTVTKTCTPSGQTSAEWGLYEQPYSTNTCDINSLVAYDSTPGSKNLASGDTLQETWTVTFS